MEIAENALNPCQLLAEAITLSTLAYFPLQPFGQQFGHVAVKLHKLERFLEHYVGIGLHCQGDGSLPLPVMAITGVLGYFFL